MKIVKEVRNSPFKPLKRKVYIGKIRYYAPYFFPRNYCPTLLSFRKLKMRTPKEMDWEFELHSHASEYELAFKNFPMVRRNKYVVKRLFGSYWFIEIGCPITLIKTNLGWKDKYNAPRFEWSPTLIFYFLLWQIAFIYEPQTEDIDNYWEMYLWWRDYCDKDLKKAEESWEWEDYYTNKTTWCKNNLK